MAATGSEKFDRVSLQVFGKLFRIGQSMSELTRESCVACRADAPRVEAEEAQKLLADVPEWNLRQDEVPYLSRVFKFPNFLEALEFTNKVGELAEQENHHPRLITEWGRVTVDWWTHKIGGLHRNDFIAAAKTDQLL